MKKIISKFEQKKKEKRKQLVLGIILVGLMVFSTIAYSFMDNSSSSDNLESELSYNGVEFSLKEEYYIGEKYNNQILLSKNPNDLKENVLINLSNSLESYSGKPLYLSSEDYLSSFIINQNFGVLNSIAQRMQLACYSEGNCPESYPIKDCSNNLIVIGYSNQSSITSFENCVFISGPEEEVSDLTNLFILKIFEI